MVDPDGKKLWPKAGREISPEWIRVILPLPVAPEMGLCGTAACLADLRHRGGRRERAAWASEEHRELALRCGIRAAWSQPILTNDNRVLGTFAVYSSQPGAPTDADLALTESAGCIAHLAIEFQRSHEALTQALDNMRDSEEELRRTTDAIAQAILVLDPDGTAMYANRVALDYAGLTLEEVRGEGFRERIIHPEDLERLHEFRQSGLALTAPFELEQRVRRKDGTYRWFLSQYNPLLDANGRTTRWYSTATDIDDHKRSENKLRQDERELRQLIDFMPQCVLVLDGDGTVLQANQTMLDYRGSTLEEVNRPAPGSWFRAGLHPDDRSACRRSESGAAAGAPFELEQRLLAKDGRIAGFSSALSLFLMNPDSLCAGLRPRRTWKTASTRKFACATKPFCCARTWCAPRCSNRW